MDQASRRSGRKAAAEFHSLSPPCVHSAETPGPFMLQPGALSCERFRYEGLSSGSPSLPVVNPRMFSASYQRYSAGAFDCERDGFTQRHKRRHKDTKMKLSAFVYSFVPLCEISSRKVNLTQSFQTLAQRALTTGEHRRVAQGVRSRLGLAQFLDQIEEVGREVRLEGDDKLLIVEPEGIRRMQFH